MHLMDKKAFLNLAIESDRLVEADRERASLILDALDGLGIDQAEGLLERCANSLRLLNISFSG